MSKTGKYEIGEADVENLKALVLGFAEKQERFEVTAWGDEESGIRHLFQNVEPVLQQYENQLRTEAVAFNIFRDLRIASLEARVHTPFIANLLNTRGTHLMGSYFLHHFLETLSLIHEDQPADAWKLHTISIEKHLGHEFGRSDIYLHLSCLGINHYWIIENKINAEDQNNQITKYCRFLSAQGGSNAKRRVFYLTRDGSDPTDDSINYKVLAELKNKVEVETLSYYKGIHGWLIRTMNSENVPLKVRLTLEQYIEMIQYI